MVQRLVTKKRVPVEAAMFADIFPQEKQEDVISKCILSEPKHGEVWQSIAKDPRNASKGVEEILKLVASRLDAS